MVDNNYRVIFLDVDGVLNHQDFYTRGGHLDEGVEYPASNMDPLAIKQLNRIIDETGAKVVVSSTWRLGSTVEKLQTILESRGFTGEVVGVTKSLDFQNEWCCRGNEIAQWIIENKVLTGLHQFDFNRYVILDDDIDMLYQQKDNFVNTSELHGLTKELADKAIKILR